MMPTTVPMMYPTASMPQVSVARLVRHVRLSAISGVGRAVSTFEFRPPNPTAALIHLAEARNRPAILPARCADRRTTHAPIHPVVDAHDDGDPGVHRPSAVDRRSRGDACP